MEYRTENADEINLKAIKIWHIVGAVVIFGLGALWHFLFEWLGHWEPIGWFFPVNESVWEHVKLMFWPALLFWSLEGIFTWKKANNFLLAKTTIFYFTPVVNIVFFYTYTGISGWESFIFDTIVLGIVVSIGQYISFKIETREPIGEDRKVLWMVSMIVAIVILAAMLIVFTYVTPEIPLFRDGSTGGYGIIEHGH